MCTTPFTDCASPVARAVIQRHSVRAFLSRPVSPEIVVDLLSMASRAPSGGNLQPWRVYALSGAPLEHLIDAVGETNSTQGAEGGSYEIYPSPLNEPFRSRRFHTGEALYRAIGVEREDRPGRLNQFSNNFRFFGAPVGLIICIDRNLGPAQWVDVGMYLQTLMLLAVEKGLGTCAQEAWSIFEPTIKRALDLPDELLVFAGLALGYPDGEAPINRFRTERARLCDFADVSGLGTEQ